jgi:hypothetical protein
MYEFVYDLFGRDLMYEFVYDLFGRDLKLNS